MKPSKKSENKKTSMYLPIEEIKAKGLSPRGIRDRVNGFKKD